MKKYFLLVLFTAVMGLSVSAQKGEKSLGLNLGYGLDSENLTIGAKFNYGVTDVIRLSPSFNYFLEKDGLSGWEINADAHYLFNVAPKFTAYPLAGLTLVRWSFEFPEIPGLSEIIGESLSASETKFGINIGAGIGYQLTDKVSVGLELKYSIVADFDQLVPILNLSYKF